MANVSCCNIPIVLFLYEPIRFTRFKYSLHIAYTFFFFFLMFNQRFYTCIYKYT